MGFRSARSGHARTDDSAREQPLATATQTDDEAALSGAPTSIEQADAYYGMAVPDVVTLQRLREHERTYGTAVHEWVEEGMAIETMGKPRDMAAFRQRQADRPEAVPNDVERQNEFSVQRSAKAAADTSNAGQTATPDSVREVISSRGRSLDSDVQQAAEQHMGDSFSDVQVHTGPQAAQACEDINARAFTVGNHIAFNHGEYDPESPEGQHTIVHELAHVRQQTGGHVSTLPKRDADLEIDPDQSLERDAEQTATRVMKGWRLGIRSDDHSRSPAGGQTRADYHVQRATYGQDRYGEEHEEFIEKQKERLYGDESGEATGEIEMGELLAHVRQGASEGALGVPLSEVLKELLMNLPIAEPWTTLAAAFLAGGTMSMYTTLIREVSAEDIRETFKAIGHEHLYYKLFGDDTDSELGDYPGDE